MIPNENEFTSNNENDKDDKFGNFYKNINILGNNYFNEDVIDENNNDYNSNRRSTLQNTFENSNSIFNQKINEPNIITKDEKPKKKSLRKKKSKKKPKKNQNDLDLVLDLFEI